MALGDWLNSIFGSDASTTPASETLGKAGYQKYSLTGPAPATGYGVTTAASAGGSPYSAAQLGLLKTLQDRANGLGPDPVQQQLALNTQNNIANQSALAAGDAVGGQNPGVAGAELARNAAAMDQQAAGQSALLRSQGMLGAASALGGLTGQGIGQAQTAADAANQEAALASGQNQGNYQFTQGVGMNEQDQYNKAIAALTGAQEQQRAAQGAATTGAVTGALGSAFNGLMGGLASDEEVKEDVSSGDSSIGRFLDGLESHSYKYKDPSMPGAAPGKHFGPMAQEIEKGGPVGESLVNDGPDGVKRVDTDRLSLALASGLGGVHRRLSAVEELLKSKHGAESHG